jgi:hypothetical protein
MLAKGDNAVQMAYLCYESPVQIGDFLCTGSLEIAGIFDVVPFLGQREIPPTGTAYASICVYLMIYSTFSL